MEFEADNRYEEVAQAYAADAVDFARNAFGRKLDYSNESIAEVEAMLGELHLKAAESKPSEEQIYQMAKMFGSYVGEVFRKHYGAEWGIVTLDGQKLPGLRALQKSTVFWPWGKANGRLVNGPEDNLVYYYKVLTEGMTSNGVSDPMPAKVEAPSPTKVESTLPTNGKTSWLRKLFGA